jgi:CRISPR-associated protein Csb2
MMPAYLCLTVRFLQPYYHGRTDGGEPEWPPSPLRVFQALVAAAATRWRETQFHECAAPSLHWLERQHAPSVVACVGQPASVKYRLYVPDNVADKVAKSWAGGREASIADYRTEKDVRPTRLHGEAVHYVFPLSDDGCPHLDVLRTAARSITHLGWGVDMVAGNASIISEEEVAKLPGQRWRSVEETSAGGCRVPIEGTLQDLIDKHNAFLSRLGPDGFNPVPPLSAFRVVGYRRATEPSQRQFAAFSILKADASGSRPFDATRRTRDVAGMVRHAVADAARRHGWSDEQINVFVHGKTPEGDHAASGEKSPDRFLYLPLPTVNRALDRVESIRRVLIAAPAHCREQAAWVRRALAGADLKNESGEIAALATNLPASDWVLRQYVAASTAWSTVTPVILPGHDDRDPAKAGKLLKTAFAQAGYAPELVNQTELEWRRVAFRAGVDLASRYLPPKNLENKPRYHVRVRFPQAIAGPLVVGSGRFRGFGLFARDENA